MTKYLILATSNVSHVHSINDNDTRHVYITVNKHVKVILYFAIFNKLAAIIHWSQLPFAKISIIKGNR